MWDNVCKCIISYSQSTEVGGGGNILVAQVGFEKKSELFRSRRMKKIKYVSQKKSELSCRMNVAIFADNGQLPNRIFTEHNTGLGAARSRKRRPFKSVEVTFIWCPNLSLSVSGSLAKNRVISDVLAISLNISLDFIAVWQPPLSVGVNRVSNFRKLQRVQGAKMKLHTFSTKKKKKNQHVSGDSLYLFIHFIGNDKWVHIARRIFPTI